MSNDPHVATGKSAASSVRNTASHTQSHMSKKDQHILTTGTHEKLSITVLIVDVRMKKVLTAINTPMMTVGFTSLTSSSSTT